jgi:hypothetical protein
MFLMCLTPIGAVSCARLLTDPRLMPKRGGTAQRSEAPLRRDRSFVRALVQVGPGDSKVEEWSMTGGSSPARHRVSGQLMPDRDVSVPRRRRKRAYSGWFAPRMKTLRPGYRPISGTEGKPIQDHVRTNRHVLRGQQDPWGAT